MQPTVVDRLVSYIAPAAGLSRMRARAAVEVLTRNFEGASQSRRLAGWRTPSTGANAAASPSLTRLRDRARDLVRNNPWAARGVGVLEANVVGSGIRPEARVASGNPAAAELAMKLWTEHAETTAIDADGRLDIYGLQCLVLRSVVESGEVLVRRRRRLATDGLKVPLQLQVLEPDHLDTSRDIMQIAGGGSIQGGIEFDSIGRRKAYWLYPEHPGERGTLRGLKDSAPVPASEILHVFRQDRPGQFRGVTWLAPAVVRLRDLDEFEDARLLQQKVAACFAGFIHDVDTSGLVDKDEDDRPPVEELEPGMLANLSAGKTITFAQPPTTEGYVDYVRFMLRAIACALGVSYEAFTGDYSGVNFSSGRMGWIEMSRTVETTRWKMLEPVFLTPMWGWFVQAAVIAGRPIGNVTATWTPPRREMIDPTKEVPMARDAIRAGLTTLSETLRENGQDPAKVFAERKKELDELDKLGLIVESDARVKIGGSEPIQNDDEEPGDGGKPSAKPGDKPRKRQAVA